MKGTVKGWLEGWQSRKSREQRWVTSDAFFHGAHGIAAKDGIAEINAMHGEKEAEFKSASMARQRVLEGRLEHLQRAAIAAEKLWGAVQQRVGDRMPHLVMPLIIAIFGAGALMSEALLLAPAMDVLKVTDPTWQLVMAFGISCGVATAFHFAWETFTSDASTLISKITCRAIGVFLAAGLVLWGVFRGYQVGFAATISQNPLGDFLSGHPFLASCFYVFVTLGIPVVAATAANFSATRLHTWWEWKTTKDRAEKLTQERAEVTNQLGSERECLTQSLRASDEKRKQHLASYRQHYQRGELCGARQEPFWIVPLKATLVAAITLAVLPFALAFSLLDFLPPIAWAAAFLYFWQRWQNPSTTGYFDLEKVRFAEPTASPKISAKMRHANVRSPEADRPKDARS